MSLFGKIKAQLQKFRAEKPPSSLVFDATGFSMVDAGKEKFRVVWSEVIEVFAYKEDMWTYDTICVGFRINETDRYFRVAEDFEGFKQLLDELPRRFPGIRPGWYLEISTPAFETKFTRLWPLNA